MIVDDALLLAVLAGVADDPLTAAVDEGEVFTTGSWYWRLGRAIRDPDGTGKLSRAFGDLAPDQRSVVLGAIDQLPDQIGLLSLRQLVPIMTVLSASTGRLNLLTAEAVASAVVLDTSIAVSTESALLTNACAVAGVEVHHMGQ